MVNSWCVLRSHLQIYPYCSIKLCLSAQQPLFQWLPGGITGCGQKKPPTQISWNRAHVCNWARCVSSLGSEIQTSKNLKIPVLQIRGSWPGNSSFSVVHSYLNEQYSCLRNGYITHFRNTSSLIFTCIYRRMVPLCPWSNLRSFSLLGGGRGGGYRGGGEEIWDVWVWKWENWKVGESGEFKSSLCEVSKKLDWKRMPSELVLTQSDKAGARPLLADTLAKCSAGQ